jgi:hypothetical protein
MNPFDGFASLKFADREKLRTVTEWMSYHLDLDTEIMLCGELNVDETLPVLALVDLARSGEIRSGQLDIFSAPEWFDTYDPRERDTTYQDLLEILEHDRDRAEQLLSALSSVFDGLARTCDSLRSSLSNDVEPTSDIGEDEPF